MNERSAFSRQLSAFALCVSMSLGFTFLTACVPARVPDQLGHTPGPAVIVTDRVFDAGIFRVRYPAGWRIVTGEARFPVAVIFVAPDAKATIKLQVGVGDNPNPPDAQFQIVVRGISLTDGTTITLIGSAPSGERAAFMPIFEQVADSVQQQ
jgi:hypothetical protein